MQQRSIPFFSLAEQTKNIEGSVKTAINEIVETQQFVGGKTVENFEKKLANYLGVTHTVSCNSGTDALWLALKALNIKKKSIVLTSPFSFLASSSEIVSHGAHPVFIDIDEKTSNICPKKLSVWLKQHATIKDNQAVHTKTGFIISGIITVDIFGQCTDWKAIKEVADKWKLWIIEDACQAIGAQLNDTQKAGTLGDISCFSFYPTKNLGAFGDGGACATNNPKLATRLSSLKNHGRKTHYDYEELGINSRMDAMQAAVLSVKLDHLDEYNKKRIAIAQCYEDNIGSIAGITTPKQNIGTHVYHQYSIKLENKEARDNLMVFLKHMGIQTRIFYPKLLSEINFLKTDPALATKCPVAQNTVDIILSLPVWPELPLDDVMFVCKIIRMHMVPNAE